MDLDRVDISETGERVNWGRAKRFDQVGTSKQVTRIVSSRPFLSLSLSLYLLLRPVCPCVRVLMIFSSSSSTDQNCPFRSGWGREKANANTKPKKGGSDRKDDGHNEDWERDLNLENTHKDINDKLRDRRSERQEKCTSTTLLNCSLHKKNWRQPKKEESVAKEGGERER